MKKKKNKRWDNPVYPDSKSDDRLVKNMPNHVGTQWYYSNGVSSVDIGVSKDKYFDIKENRNKKYEVRNESEIVYSSKERTHNRVNAQKAGMEQEYPASCNLTKKDIFEEYPYATIICSSCNFMLKGDTRTIYIDSKQCQNNEYEIKIMQKYRKESR